MMANLLKREAIGLGRYSESYADGSVFIVHGAQRTRLTAEGVAELKRLAELRRGLSPQHRAMVRRSRSA